MQWSFNAVGPVHADIEVPSGRVTVHPQAGDSLDVALQPAKPGSPRGEELVAHSEVRFESDQLTIHVPSKKFKNAEILCDIAIPEGSSIRMKGASADFVATARIGAFVGATASGDVRIGEADEVELSTASGDIRCENVHGRLRVKAASGDVMAKHVGGDVDVSLASGDVQVDDAAQSVAVSTASGDVRIGCAHEGRLTMNSVSGDIVIGLAKGAGAHLDVSSVSGEMKSSLPIDENIEPPTTELVIKCRTISGDVHIQPGS